MIFSYKCFYYPILLDQASGTFARGSVPASLLRGASARQVPLVGWIRWYIELVDGVEREDVMRERGITCEGRGKHGCSHQEQ